MLGPTSLGSVCRPSSLCGDNTGALRAMKSRSVTLVLAPDETVAERLIMEIMLQFVRPLGW